MGVNIRLIAGYEVLIVRIALKTMPGELRQMWLGAKVQCKAHLSGAAWNEMAASWPG